MAGEGVFVHAHAEAGRITDHGNATRNVDVKLAKLSKEWRVVREVFANNCVRQHRTYGAGVEDLSINVKRIRG